jgi:multiple sugar transport system substrate-binding protein
MRRSCDAPGTILSTPHPLVLAFAIALPWLWPATSQAWSYKEAAAPYAGQSITVLDEVTPLQETMQKLVPQFEQDTGIDVDYQLLNHFEVINRGQADLLSGRGEYDAIMVHSPQMGLLLDAGVLRPIDDMIAKPELTSPDLDLDDLIQPSWDTVAKYQDETYGFLTWAYNAVYWARGDLLSHPEEQAAFKAKYGYDLAPAQTLQQMRDIAEFFTRKKGAKLAGQTLESDFYGILLEGIKGGTTWWTVWNAFVRNWGGDIFDENGTPSVDRPENVAAIEFWGDLWQFGPPGMAEASLIDVPTLMGQGVTAQALAWSDFGLGIDRHGASPYAGKFVYAPSPANADYDGPRSAEVEPSILILARSSDAPEATYLFLQWLADRTTQLALAEQLGAGVPNRYSLFETPTYKDSRFAPLYAAMRGSLEYGKAKPRVPKIYEINDALAGLVQQVGLGQLTAEEAMARGQSEVLSICDRCTLSE